VIFSAPELCYYTVSQKKTIFDIFDSELETNYQIFIIFGMNILDAIKWPFSFPPHPTFVSALPRKNTTSEISLFYLMQYDCLINISHKNTFCLHFWHFGWHFIQSSIFQLSAVKLLEVLAHYVNTDKETLSLLVDSSIHYVLLQTNPGYTSCFLTSQTFLYFI